ncbi:hypothetical protein SMICM304S_08931 [Streptomyces microflavus]
MKFSIQRVIDINSDSGPVGLLANIDTIETKGDNQVVFHLNTPDATFPYKLATPAAGIVPKGKYPAKEARDGFQVDGSGPYTMKPQTEDGRVTRITFTKNPSYKGELKVLNDKVDMDLFPDAEAMGKALEEKKIHMMTRAMSPEQARDMLVKPKEGIELTEMPGLAVSYLGLDQGPVKAYGGHGASPPGRDPGKGRRHAEPLYRAPPASRPRLPPSRRPAPPAGPGADAVRSPHNHRPPAAPPRPASTTAAALGAPANSSVSSGFDSSSRSHWPGINARARGAVRSAAGASKSRSSTAWTSVPRVAASLGFSGSLSMTRKR